MHRVPVEPETLAGAFKAEVSKRALLRLAQACILTMGNPTFMIDPLGGKASRC